MTHQTSIEKKHKTIDWPNVKKMLDEESPTPEMTRRRMTHSPVLKHIRNVQRFSKMILTTRIMICYFNPRHDAESTWNLPFLPISHYDSVSTSVQRSNPIYDDIHNSLTLLKTYFIYAHILRNTPVILKHLKRYGMRSMMMIFNFRKHTRSDMKNISRKLSI